MDTPGAAEAAVLLRDFRFDDPMWVGRAFVPFWGCDLDVSIDPDDDGITARQLSVLRAVLTRPRNLRAGFGKALYAYYRDDVDGTYCSYDDRGVPIPGSGPPKLTAAAQVWDLIDEPVVCIPVYFHTRSGVEFQLSFNCEWDKEHGLGVSYRGWKPVEFGGRDL